MSKTYTTVQANISGVRLYKSTGTGCKSDFPNGIKECTDYDFDTKTRKPYSGPVLNVKFEAPGHDALYMDILTDTQRGQKAIESLCDFAAVSKAEAQPEDLEVPMWGFFLVPSVPVFLRVSRDEKDGKVYHNIYSFGPTAASVEPAQQQEAPKFAARNPMSGKSIGKNVKRGEAPKASAPAAAPAADAGYPDDSGIPF